MYSDAATTKTAMAATMNTNRAAPPAGSRDAAQAEHPAEEIRRVAHQHHVGQCAKADAVRVLPQHKAEHDGVDEQFGAAQQPAHAGGKREAGRRERVGAEVGLHKGCHGKAHKQNAHRHDSGAAQAVSSGW